MQYTNIGLVKHAQNALKLNTKYMWGGLLREITPSYISQLKSLYGNKTGTGYTNARWAELQALAGRGYYGVDCVGLIKSYYWSGKQNGGTGSPGYESKTDVNAGIMYGKSKSKGQIKSMPEVPGLVVYSKSHPHVGVYIGNGYTIESTLGVRGDGVVKRRLDSFWEYWFECPFIEYGAKPIAEGEKKEYVITFGANIRDKPTIHGVLMGRYTPGKTVTIIPGSDTKDPISGSIYVRVEGDKEMWIVKSALK